MLALFMGISLTACGRESIETPGGEMKNGVAAIGDAMLQKRRSLRVRKPSET